MVVVLWPRMLIMLVFGLAAYSIKRVKCFAGRYHQGNRFRAFQNAITTNKRESMRPVFAAFENTEPRNLSGIATKKAFGDGVTDGDMPLNPKPVTKIYKTDSNHGFDMNCIRNLVDSDDVSRLGLTSRNISVPVALMMLDPKEYPTRSKARKACRKSNIMIHRGPLEIDKESGEETVDLGKCIQARVGFRVFPGDVLCKQDRIGNGKYRTVTHERPPFELPVLFEDDHFAIVNKPEGVVVYATKGAGDGLMTIRAAIPFAVTPSKAGTCSTLSFPQPVHRLDKPTSGVLILAKTKPAMVNLSQQFCDRTIKKTYTAIVNGIPPEPPKNTISTKEAFLMGVDVDPGTSEDEGWQGIDNILDGKSAITVWKTMKHSNSIYANKNVLTTVILKPKTGRYHQLRKHMSLVCKCPIVGDEKYDGGGSAERLRKAGLFLCSNKVTLEHPFFNDLKENHDSMLHQLPKKERNGLWLSPEGKIMVTATVELPDKFTSFVNEENSKFSEMLSDTHG